MTIKNINIIPIVYRLKALPNNYCPSIFIDVSSKIVHKHEIEKNLYKHSVRLYNMLFSYTNYLHIKNIKNSADNKTK